MKKKKLRRIRSIFDIEKWLWIVLFSTFNSKTTKIRKNIFMAVFVVLCPKPLNSAACRKITLDTLCMAYFYIYLVALRSNVDKLLCQLGTTMRSTKGQTAISKQCHLTMIILFIIIPFKKISKFPWNLFTFRQRNHINLLYPWFWNSTTDIAITSIQEKIPESEQ